MSDPLLTTGSDKCRCSVCGAYFKRSGTFAAHRVGDWQKGGGQRRCRTAAEMLAMGWLLEDNFWIQGRMPARAHAHWYSGGDLAEPGSEGGS